jgi:hypothetical protein
MIIEWQYPMSPTNCPQTVDSCRSGDHGVPSRPRALASWFGSSWTECYGQPSFAIKVCLSGHPDRINAVSVVPLGLH